MIGKGSENKHEGVSRSNVRRLSSIIGIKEKDCSYEESQKLYAAHTSYN